MVTKQSIPMLTIEGVARHEADRFKRHVAIYRKPNGQHYLVRTASDVLPGSTRVRVISPRVT